MLHLEASSAVGLLICVECAQRVSESSEQQVFGDDLIGLRDTVHPRRWQGVPKLRVPLGELSHGAGRSSASGDEMDPLEQTSSSVTKTGVRPSAAGLPTPSTSKILGDPCQDSEGQVDGMCVA